MRTTWMVGTMVLFLLGQIISQTLDYQAGYVDSYAAGTFWSLMHPQHVTGGNIPIIGFFVIVWNWIQAIWNALSWNYTFLQGDYEIFRYFGWCISIGMVVSIVFAVRGTSST